MTDYDLLFVYLYMACILSDESIARHGSPPARRMRTFGPERVVAHFREMNTGGKP